MKITPEHSYIIFHFDVHRSWDFFQFLEFSDQKSDALSSQIDHLLYQASINEGELDFIGIEIIMAFIFEKNFTKIRNYPPLFFENLKIECDGETVDFIIDMSETIVKEACVHLLKNLIQSDLFEYQLLRSL